MPLTTPSSREWFLWTTAEADRHEKTHRAQLLFADGAETQGVHDGERPRAHSKNVAQDTADAGGGALKRLDEGGVIMGLDLESAGPAVADINDAGILSRPLHHELAACRQPLEVDAGGLVGAVLAPHDAVDAQLREPGSPPQGGNDPLVLFGCDAVLSQKFRRNRD